MKSTRRQFIKVTGLATGGIVSGLPSLAQFFDFIPSAEQTFIPVTGIFANPSSILDKGVHLRWSLPPSKGIPDLIKIFRRKSDGSSGVIKLNPADSNQAQLPSSYRALTFDGSRNSFSLTETLEGKCYKVKPIDPSKKIKVIFSENITSCVIQLGDIKRSKILVFHPDNSISHELLTENQSGKSSIHITAKNGRPFKSIEIPLNFSYLYSFEFTGNQYVCESKGWELIGNIDNAEDLKKTNLFNRISITTRNFYIKSLIDRERYEKIAKQYEGLMTIMQSPSEEYFQKNKDYQSISAIPFEKLNIKSTNSASSSLNAYNLFLIGCIDPNIARLAGLYFVDTSAKDPDVLYDYKVEAKYNNNYYQKTLCGVILNVGGKYSELPTLQEPLITTQIQSTRWEFDNEYNPKHLGKVRIAWKEINQNPTGLSWKRFIEPVVYNLQVDSNKPRLISPRADDSYLFFIDQNAKVENPDVEYRVSGIDIFGQKSNELKSKIRLNDRDIPACPVRLNFSQSNNQTALNLEYGGFQYLTDPEVTKLDVYIKKDSIYKQNIKAKYNSFTQEGNNAFGSKLIQIYLNDSINTTTQYISLHFIETTSGEKLPAAKRKKFKVVEQSENKVLIVIENEDNYLPESNGTVLLEADSRDKKNGWTRLNNSPIYYKPPIQTRLIAYNHFVNESSDDTHFISAQRIGERNSFKARIIKIQHKKYSDNKDLFNPNTDIENDLYTEVTINRTLNESDIFTEGLLKQGQATFSIIAQNAGYNSAIAEAFETKLVFNGHVSLSIGEVSLIPPTFNVDINGFIEGFMIFWLSGLNDHDKIHTGEFLLKGTKIYPTNENDQSATTIKEEPANVICTVLSDIYKNNDQLQVLVRVPTKVSFLHTERTTERSNKVLYFKPYSFDITETLNSNPLLPKEPFKNFYFAANAIDKAGNESPLSVIAQFIKTRSKNDKPPTPSKPFPCGNPDATEAYLKLPNSEGISFFKLCWNDSTDYRYEVGRASDKSIVASHRDLWLKGLSYTTDDQQSVTLNSLINIGSLDSQNGTIEVRISSTNMAHPEIYLGGRLIQGTGAVKKCFEILKANTVDSQVLVLLRPLLKGNVPTNTTSIIQKLPDYPSILQDDAILTRIANLTPPAVPTPQNPYFPDSLGAFSVVTGQPLRDENSFLDEVPGLGTSRFFYKIRAVDGSENRSLWSEASIAVWQVDTRVPDAPIITYIEGQEQAAYIKWKNEGNEKITGYRLFRTDKKVDKKVTSDYATETLIKTFVRSNPQTNETLLSYAKIRVRYNQIELPVVEEILNVSNRITGIFKVSTSGEPDININYFISNITALSGQSIINLPPSIRDGVKVVVVLKSNTNTEIVIYSNDSGNLQSVGGQIILPTFQNIDRQDPIKGIFKIEEYKYGQLVEDQKAENYAIKSPTQFIAKYHLLKGIYSGLIQGEEVAIQITKTDTSMLIIKEDQTEYEYTDNLKDTLTLDLFYNYRMESIKQLNVTTPPAKICSLKSKDALVQIKMNTPPLVPEIVSVEWWDWERNVAAGQNTYSYALRLYDFNLPSTLTYNFFISNNEDGIFMRVKENNIRKTLSNDFINQIIVKTNALEQVLLKLTMTDKWGNNNNVFHKKGL